MSQFNRRIPWPARQSLGPEALLTLAYHGWTEPVERVLTAAEQAGVKVLTPRPGQSVEPDVTPPIARWWPSLPWTTAADDPLVSTITR